LITSGGVSMGDFDYVKSVLQRIGDMRWMQIDIKPAKPLAFGLIGDTPIFGLPGNPVSSMVSFELFARPGLRAMMGRADPLRKRVVATAVESLGRRPDGKTHFVRAIVDYADGKVFVRSGGGQGSHMLAAMARSNSLAILPDGSGYSKGDSLEVLILD
jgi:molybdopterin molybdotransferase